MYCTTCIMVNLDAGHKTPQNVAELHWWIEETIPSPHPPEVSGTTNIY